MADKWQYIRGLTLECLGGVIFIPLRFFGRNFITVADKNLKVCIALIGSIVHLSMSLDYS